MTLQNQILRKKCTVCDEFIYLFPTVISENGHKIPMNGDGTRHNLLHGYIHRKAKEIRYRREYQEVIEAIAEELDFKEAA